MEADTTKVLLVSKDAKLSILIKQVLTAPLFALTEIADFNEARRRLMEESFGIIIADFSDGDGQDFASETGGLPSAVLLLIPNELFDQVSYRTEAYGILPVTKPFDFFYFYNMIKAAMAVKAKFEQLTYKTVQLRNKLEEIRIVNRAKMLLISHKGMSEEEAHRYIEQTAMNRCQKRIQIAQEIVRELGSGSD